MMKKLIIGHVVGYMLKIMKSGIEINKFKNEFAAIRHGNYDDFIYLVKGEKPPIIVYQNGIISNQDIISQKTHCDFANLILSGPSLKKFFNDCQIEYGDKFVISEDEISNEIYYKVALFEISLRMHASNQKLMNNREKLVDIINKLGDFKKISFEEM